MDYLYDGSFDGLLTCIYYHYYEAAASGIYQQDHYQPSLMVNTRIVETNPAWAMRVYTAIEEKISRDALEKIYHVYLSSDSNKENLILNYLRLGFKMGAKVDHFHSHPDVYFLHKVNRKVTLETHRLLGLLRFKDMGQFLYAAISPDHNILPLIADHFADRLAGERWIIHDLMRKLAIIYDGQNDKRQKSIRDKWYLSDFPYSLEEIADKDQHWPELWQLYFNRIGIEARLNPRLQSQFVPQRYRRYLLEFHQKSD